MRRLGWDCLMETEGAEPHRRGHSVVCVRDVRRATFDIAKVLFCCGAGEGNCVYTSGRSGGLRGEKERGMWSDGWIRVCRFRFWARDTLW